MRSPKTFRHISRSRWATECLAGSCLITFTRRGYHCDPKLPLPFLGIASQKNHIALYHMGMYTEPKLRAWFEKEWPRHSSKKLDMGKSCIRFRKPDDVPVELLGQLASKMMVEEWIEIYEKHVKR